MTAPFKIINNSKDKNLVLQLFVDGGRKNKKADPIILKPGENTDLTIWPGVNCEVAEEQQDEPIGPQT